MFILKLLELSYISSYFSKGLILLWLAIGLELHFFVTCSLVYIVVVKRTNTVFSRLVVEIGLLVSISTFRSS